MNEDAHRVEPVEEHIDSEVVLEVVDEVGTVEVLLHHVAHLAIPTLFYDSVTVPAQKNALALRQALWLYDVSLFPRYSLSVGL